MRLGWPGKAIKHPSNNFSSLDVQCPHCRAEGHFDTVFSGERKPQSRPDFGMLSLVLKCTQCGNFMYVVAKREKHTIFRYWTAPDPEPNPEEVEGPQDWPDLVRSGWEQASRCLM